MKKSTIIILAILVLSGVIGFVVGDDSKTLQQKQVEVVPWVDNNGYWIKMAEMGLATLNPENRDIEPAVYTGSELNSRLVVTTNSPDVPVTEENSTQSENSVFINPNDNQHILNSNNSTTDPGSGTSLFGADDLYSYDGGETWEGEIEGAGGNNSGDPTTAIDHLGRWYVGFITTASGQGIAYSDDEGETWTSVNVANSYGGFNLLDKNHMWIDNSPTSPYQGNLYDAWTPLSGSGPNIDEIELCYSNTRGESWSSPKGISQAVNAGNHNQGVNLSTGPNGEVYAVWTIYDSWPSDENAMGFAKSYDGGETWEPAIRIIENIRGIRNSETSKNMRVNSFPVMDVDISNGPNRGDIYVVWSNIGEPGINNGPDISVYMIKSTDEGETWSDPIRVNQDDFSQGNEHYFPWIACDPETGSLSVVYYDDRNVGPQECEAWVSNSLDGGESWEDMKVSDVSFTPSPIPGLASGYFGDYLGITARGGWVYPSWTDNRESAAMTYVSPYQLVQVVNPYNLQAELDEETGEVDLSWQLHSGGVGFEHFKIYRDGELEGATVQMNYTDQLPDYGIYEYTVIAIFQGGLESDPVSTSVQWGSAQIAANPQAIQDTLLKGSTSTETFWIHNIGELELSYFINLYNADNDNTELAYCLASGGCTEYISRVQVGEIDNSSDCDGYADYTDQSTNMRIGEEYEISIENGNGNLFDRCGIWIDWDQDESFSDENPVEVNGSPGAGPYTATIVPPPYATQGSTRMRIRINYTDALSPCGNAPRGEVEDYTVNIEDWINMQPYAGNIPAGDSVEISSTIDGSKVAAGEYSYNIVINSNDPDNPEYTIPYDFLVIPMLVNASADPTEICPGGSSQLHVEVEGGSGNYAYSWTSEPEGYTSTEQDPVFESIMENTTFFVEVDDGENQVTGNVEVMVHPKPQVDLGTDVSICQGEEHTFMAEGDYASYLWSNGSTNDEITVSESGEYWVEVTNEFGCVNTDTVSLMVNPLPQISLGPDTMICEDEILVLDAGNPDASHYWSTGATTQTISIDTNHYDFGTYEFWVEVTDMNSCVNYDTVAVELKNCSFGVDEIFAKTSLQIYPNPNEGSFTLTLQSPANQILNISILNSSGRKIYSAESVSVNGRHEMDIKLETATSGILMLMLEKDGNYKMEKVILR